MKIKYIVAIFIMLPSVTGLTGCASGHTKEIVWGMVAGAAVGALVGNQFVHSGQYNQYKTQNTVATAAVFALGTAAVMNWHYDALQDQEVEISGRFARTRLCDTEHLDPALVKQLSSSSEAQSTPVRKEQVGQLSISLDDETRWAYPFFQKRFLQPERGDVQVLSSRYIWEIIRPGQFVTRSQNPEYFVEPKFDAPAKPASGEATKQ
jgi:hypothetical protein